MNKPLTLKELKNKLSYGVYLSRSHYHKLRDSLLLYLILYPQVKYYQILLKPPKEISAMMRVKNEEEFLEASIESIISHVEEVIIVDNLSTDNTPAIIKKLKNKYPEKIKSYIYRHQVAKIGKDSNKMISRDKKSIHHLTNYTNWSLKKCTKPYILKWDGDMIATDEFYSSLKIFKHSNYELINNIGLNIFSDKKHSVKTINYKKRLEKDFFPGCFNSRLNEFTWKEFRIFPKKFAWFTNDLRYLELFSSPFTSFPKLILDHKEIAFLHLKFCKKDPYEIIPKDMAAVIEKNLLPGKEIPQKYLKILNSLPRATNSCS